jgi:UDP-N-acetylglucosamine--N-acetylmuramyl-(pentapeptide) pyrophosphoryl-undecaprenol N-acetylglucosamine transferase
MKILFTGGGTGGHIMPVLAVAEEIRKTKSSNKKLEFMFIGPDNDFNKAISGAGIEVKTIKAGKLRRYFSLENLTDIFKIIFGTIQSLYIVYKFRPDVVFSKGGFASVPPVIASWIWRVPILSHESDIVPGLANKIISRFTKKIYISFKDTEKYLPSEKTVLVNSLIREDILNGDKNRARKIFDLEENVPTILIFGGSQGAQKVNEVALKALPAILEKYQVIHICGMKNYEKIKDALKHKRYKLYPYLNDNLKEAYALCDVVISRAGANSLFEIIALEKPSIIIPLPTSANNHQCKNAEYFSRKGMIVLVKEEDLTEVVLEENIFKLLQEEDYRSSIIKMTKEYNYGRKNAAELIAKEIIYFC